MDKKYLFIELADILTNEPYLQYIIEFEGGVHNKATDEVTLRNPRVTKINCIDPEVKASTLTGEVLNINYYGSRNSYVIKDCPVAYKWFKKYVFESQEAADLFMELKEK